MPALGIPGSLFCPELAVIWLFSCILHSSLLMSSISSHTLYPGVDVPCPHSFSSHHKCRTHHSHPGLCLTPGPFSLVPSANCLRCDRATAAPHFCTHSSAKSARGIIKDPICLYAHGYMCICGYMSIYIHYTHTHTHVDTHIYVCIYTEKERKEGREGGGKDTQVKTAVELDGLYKAKIPSFSSPRETKRTTGILLRPYSKTQTPLF